MAISPLTLIFNSVNNASPGIRQIIDDIKSNFIAVGQLSHAYNDIEGVINKFVGAGRQAYQQLIGQNVELQNQLLATQASIAATNKIISLGAEIKDPTKAILALKEPTDQAIASLRKGSLDLVGVTSRDLVPVFQLIAQQSASIGANLNDSSKLTLSFAAALGTLQIPLYRARQEVDSILQGQITSDSQLAKSIGLNNEMVSKWKAQGTVVEKLTERLAAFRAGNQLAAQTVSGITSNIREIFDEVSRVAGSELLKPIVDQLTIVYNFLKDNQALIGDVANNVVTFFLAIGTKLGEAVAILQPVIETLAKTLFTQLSAEGSAAATVITQLVNVFVSLVVAAAPLLKILADITGVVAELLNSDLGRVFLQTVIYVNLLNTAFIEAKLAIDLFTLSIALSNSGVLGLIPGLNAVIAAIGKFSVAFTLSGGGLAGLQAGLSSLVAGLFVTKGAVVGLYTALTPLAAGFALAATAAAGLGLALLLVEKYRLRDNLKELSGFTTLVNERADAARNLAAELIKLNNAEKTTGKLTPEEEKRRTQLSKNAANEIETLRSLQEDIKASGVSGTESLIGGLNVSITQLQRQSGGIKAQVKDIQELGNTYEQLGKQAANALNKFDITSKSPAATQDELEKSASGLVKITAKAFELGQVSAETAREIGKSSSQIAVQRLESVRDDARVTYETQLSAQQEITKIRQAETDKQVKISEIASEKIQALVAGESISQYEGQKRTTEEKIKQLKIQLAAVGQSIKEEQALRNNQINGNPKELVNQAASVQKQITSLELKEKKTRLSDEETAQKRSLGLQLDYLNKLATQKSYIQKLDDDSFTLQTQRDDLTAKSQDSGKLTADEQLKARVLDSQLTQLAGQKVVAQKTLQEDNKSLQDKKVQQQKFSTEITTNEGQQTDRRRKQAIKDFDDQIQILDSSNERKQITQEQFNLRSFELEKGKAKLELIQISERQARLIEQQKRTGKVDKEGQEQLDTERAASEKKIVVSTEKFHQTQVKAATNAIDAEQKELAASYADGQVSQENYNAQSLAITQARLKIELDEVNYQRSRLKAGDKQGGDALDAQQADIRKRSLDAQVQFQDSQVALVERDQRRATSIISQSESERAIEIAKIRLALPTEKAKADQLETQSSRKKLEAQLDAEKEALAKLQALPPYSDPVKEEARQSQIKASRLQTSQFTLSLINNEVQQRERSFGVIEEALKRQEETQQNTSKEQTQNLQKEIQLSDLLVKSLQTQNSLLEARKSLSSSLTSFYEGELGIIKETSHIEIEKRQIAETTAQIKLTAVREQVIVEREILKLNLQQKEAALAQERLTLQASKLDARSNTLTAINDQKIVNANPGATDQQKEASRLKVESSITKEVSLQAQGKILDQKGELNQIQSRIELENFNRKSIVDDDKARLDVAKSRVDIVAGRMEQQRLYEELKNRTNLPDYQAIKSFGLRFDPSIDTPTVTPLNLSKEKLAEYDATIRNQLKLGIPVVNNPNLPTSQLALDTKLVAGASTQKSANTLATSPLNAAVSQVGTVSITNNVYLTKDDLDSAKSSEKILQPLRKELKEIGLALTSNR